MGWEGGMGLWDGSVGWEGGMEGGMGVWGRLVDLLWDESLK